MSSNSCVNIIRISVLLVFFCANCLSVNSNSPNNNNSVYKEKNFNNLFKKNDKNSRSPIMQIELFRHGARTPVINIHKEKWIDDNGGTGTLLPTGKIEHYNLGKALKDSYPSIFNTRKDLNSESKMYSSSMTRCIESAQSHLEGIYGENISLKGDPNDKVTQIPPFQQAMINENKNFQQNLEKSNEEKNKKNLIKSTAILPVWTFDKNHDYIFLRDNGKYVCPNSYNLIEEQKSKICDDMMRDMDAPGWMGQKGDSINKKLEKFSLTPTKLAEVDDDFSKDGKFTLAAMDKLQDVWKGYLYNFGTLPSKITEKIYNQVELLSYIEQWGNWANKEITKLYSNDISKLIELEFNNKVDSIKKDVKYLNYIGLSGHDSNLALFISLLDKGNFDCWRRIYRDKTKASHLSKNLPPSPECMPYPNFADNIIWELSQNKENKNNNEYWVRMLYNGKNLNICKTQDGYCTQKNFQEFNKNYFQYHRKYKALCGGNPELMESGNYLDIINWALIFIGLFFIIIAMQNYYKYKKVREISHVINQQKELEMQTNSSIASLDRSTLPNISEDGSDC